MVSRRCGSSLRFLGDVLRGLDVVCMQDTKHCADDRFGWLPGFAAFGNVAPDGAGQGKLDGRNGTPFGLITLVRHGLAAKVVKRGARCLIMEVRGARGDVIRVANAYLPPGDCDVRQSTTLERRADPRRRPREQLGDFERRAAAERAAHADLAGVAPRRGQQAARTSLCASASSSAA